VLPEAVVGLVAGEEDAGIKEAEATVEAEGARGGGGGGGGRGRGGGSSKGRSKVIIESQKHVHLYRERQGVDSRHQKLVPGESVTMYCEKRVLTWANLKVKGCVESVPEQAGRGRVGWYGQDLHRDGREGVPPRNSFNP
jgi:hypothetical protein